MKIIFEGLAKLNPVAQVMVIVGVIILLILVGANPIFGVGLIGFLTTMATLLSDNKKFKP